jgi:endonuclease YncB( thermonuclease family)
VTEESADLSRAILGDIRQKYGRAVGGWMVNDRELALDLVKNGVYSLFLATNE